MALELRIVTPKAVAWEGQATEVLAPGFHGQFGVLPTHERLLSVAVPGRVVIHGEQGVETFVVGSGFIEVGPDHVTVLTGFCEPLGGVDPEQAARDLAQAEADLVQCAHGTAAWDEAERRAGLARAKLG